MLIGQFVQVLAALLQQTAVLRVSYALEHDGGVNNDFVGIAGFEHAAFACCIIAHHQPHLLPLFAYSLSPARQARDLWCCHKGHGKRLVRLHGNSTFRYIKTGAMVSQPVGWKLKWWHFDHIGLVQWMWQAGECGASDFVSCIKSHFKYTWR